MSDVSKKTRFEVFKRDSFMCVYCGRSAPEIVLECDHLHPKAKGGLNDILNLVTACRDCNAGKSDRLLKDNSVIAKQKASLDELNERRLQLEMLMQWRTGMESIDDDRRAALVQAINAKTAGLRVVAEPGERHVRSWLKKFDFAELLAAVDASFDQYVVLARDGTPTVESWEKALRLVPTIARVRRELADKPYMKDALYGRGILRQRYQHNLLDEYYYGDALDLLDAAFALGATKESVHAFCKSVTNWQQFVDEMERFCAAQRTEEVVDVPADDLVVGLTGKWSATADDLDRAAPRSR